MSYRSNIVYGYDGSFDGLLSVIFDAFSRREVPEHIFTYANEENTLFAVHEVENTEDKAKRVGKWLKGFSSEVFTVFYYGYLTCIKNKEMELLMLAIKLNKEGNPTGNVLSRDELKLMLEIAKGSGVDLCHENEKGIYGETEQGCLDLYQALPELKGIFDPANFVQCGRDTKIAWPMLAPYIKYLHIKDALADGSVVPAGKGIGNLAYILGEYQKQGGNAVTLEPHLTVFKGLAELERAGEQTQTGVYRYPDSDSAFDAACEALKEILDTLTEREADVLRMRFGMYDGRTHTLEEVGQIFGVTRERIRQIENKAIRKLRHPSRAKKIKDFYC